MTDASTQTKKPFVILAAIDESDSASWVVKAAASYANGRSDVELHVLHAYVPLSTKGIFDDGAIKTIDTENHLQTEDHVAKLVELGNAETNTKGTRGHIVSGDPTQVILGVAGNLKADLIVIGTHDYRGITRFLLGSVSEVVAKKAHCPVALIRPTKYPEVTVPTVEPPCADCTRVRSESNQEKQWCERHSQHHAKAILHYEYPASFGVGAQTFRSEG